jgi:hypothetical protein
VATLHAAVLLLCRKLLYQHKKGGVMSNIPGITFNPESIDRARVVALPDNHMQTMTPPPKSVMVGTYPPDDPSWLRLDQTYPAQMRQRFDLLAHRPAWVLDRIDAPQVCAAEVELRDRVVSWLTTQHPGSFTRSGDTVTSSLTGIAVDVGPAGAAPMAAVAALASEDFLLMLPSGKDAQGQTVYRLKSGALCFPNGWSLRSFFNKPEPPTRFVRKHEEWSMARAESIISARLGRSTYEIHQGRVPQYEVHFATGVDRMFSAMPAERVLWRRNWAPHMSPELFRHADAHNLHDRDRMTQKSLLERGFIRSEHETFVKLPHSGAIVFGIKTYLWPLREMLREPQVFNALATAAANSTPQTREYQVGRIELLERLLTRHRKKSAPRLGAVQPPA